VPVIERVRKVSDRWHQLVRLGLMDSASSSPTASDPVSMLLDGLEADADLELVHRAVGDIFIGDRTLSSRRLLELASSAFLAWCVAC
jgi:hypothetical protein